jgi:hypothetical protein
VRVAKALQAAGAQLITVHGRTKEQNKVRALRFACVLLACGCLSLSSGCFAWCAWAMHLDVVSFFPRPAPGFVRRTTWAPATGMASGASSPSSPFL